MNDLILYTTEDGRSQIQLRADLGTVWLSQLDMAELFQTSKQNIAKHLKAIFAEQELSADSVVNQRLTTAPDGKNYRVAHYNLDAILAVPGLDGIFIGPMDLATSMGHFGDPSQPDVKAAIASIEARVLGSGKVLATVANSWEQAQALYDKGYQLLTVMADGASLGKLAGESVARFRAAYPNG